MKEMLLLTIVALLATLAISGVLAGLPMLLRLRRLLREDARRDAAVRPWAMYEGDDA